MAQPVFIITIREAKRLWAPRLGTEVSGYGGRVGGFHQVIQLQALNALGVELAGEYLETGVFQALARITFSCSDLCASHRLRGTPKLCCAYIPAALCESPRIFTRAGVVPAVEAIQRAFDIGFASVAQRALLGNGFLQMQAAARPKTTRSSGELPPRRLAPWTDTGAISPTANRPGNHHVFALLIHGQHGR